VPYITSIERHGIERGVLIGLRESVLANLINRFGEVPEPIRTAVNALDDADRLRELREQTFRVAGIEAFQAILNAVNASPSP
jgi:hypothetical protein